jgi:hypothetical protein
MALGEREAVRLDVEAAVDFMARLQRFGVGSAGWGMTGAVDYVARRSNGGPTRIAVVAEQDSSNPAVMAGCRHRRVAGLALISGRLSPAAKQALSRSSKPVFCMVSKEDRRGFRDMIDAYLASKNLQSRIMVLEGLALGTTMFSTWRHERPDEEPLEEAIAEWLALLLRGGKARRVQ